MAGAVQHMKKFMEEVGETTRQLEQVLAEIRGPQQHEGEHGEDGDTLAIEVRKHFFFRRLKRDI